MTPGSKSNAAPLTVAVKCPEEKVYSPNRAGNGAGVGLPTRELRGRGFGSPRGGFRGHGRAHAPPTAPRSQPRQQFAPQQQPNRYNGLDASMHAPSSFHNHHHHSSFAPPSQGSSSLSGALSFSTPSTASTMSPSSGNNLATSSYPNYLAGHAAAPAPATALFPHSSSAVAATSTPFLEGQSDVLSQLHTTLEAPMGGLHIGGYYPTPYDYSTYHAEV
ncbi:hypothetical protein R3P38DRAFT_3183336 [Favolaschia claudopus]|uniref:Uncharacterized protein n=1 Tax=Favolaschia claudopus TaxID=2862362 RepID=A0AAW0CGW4_9AGAR